MKTAFLAASGNGLRVRGLLVRLAAPAMRGLVVAALALALSQVIGCGSSGPDTPQAAPRLQATLVRVVDGDTIWVRMPDGREEKVRYIGIDAPELADGATSAEFLADDASVRNTRLLGSGALQLELDVEERDPHGRLLAYVWAGGLLVNEQLVLEDTPGPGRILPT